MDSNNQARDKVQKLVKLASKLQTMAKANTVLVGHSAELPSLIHSSFPCWFSVSYDEHEIIYKWENFKLEINENAWKPFDFDFRGMYNKTEIISTPVGRCPEGAQVGQSLRK